MNELLKALADADREREAPAAVEMRLRAAFRKKHQRRVWPYFALAAAIAAAFVLSTNIKRPPLKPQVIESRNVAPIEPPVVARNEAPTPRKVVHRRPPQPKEEIATEFYPLMEDPLPFERGELLRVSLPAAAMRTVGVPVSEDRLGEIVQADVLVGQEGLARAIRFVNTANRP